VKPGDRRLFIDLTGPDLEILLTAGAIAACDFADMGFTVLPVRVEFPDDTPWGRAVTTPYYFQPETTVVADAERRWASSGRGGGRPLRKMGTRSG
jgi:phenylalanyl-tRNA synthetase beta chain